MVWRLEEAITLTLGHPCERSADGATRRERGIFDGRHQRLVIGVALLESCETTQIGTRNEYHVNAFEICHLLDNFYAGRLLDHRDDHNVFVSRDSIV